MFTSGVVSATGLAVTTQVPQEKTCCARAVAAKLRSRGHGAAGPPRTASRADPTPGRGRSRPGARPALPTGPRPGGCAHVTCGPRPGPAVGAAALRHGVSSLRRVHSCTRPPPERRRPEPARPRPLPAPRAGGSRRGRGFRRARPCLTGFWIPARGAGALLPPHFPTSGRTCAGALSPAQGVGARLSVPHRAVRSPQEERRSLGKRVNLGAEPYLHGSGHSGWSARPRPHWGRGHLPRECGWGLGRFAVRVCL